MRLKRRSPLPQPLAGVVSLHRARRHGRRKAAALIGGALAARRIVKAFAR